MGKGQGSRLGLQMATGGVRRLLTSAGGWVASAGGWGADAGERKGRLMVGPGVPAPQLMLHDPSSQQVRLRLAAWRWVSGTGQWDGGDQPVVTDCKAQLGGGIRSS